MSPALLLPPVPGILRQRQNLPLASTVSMGQRPTNMTTYLVAAAAAAIIYYIGKEVVGSFGHPTDDTLTRYWSGELQRTDQKSYRRTSEHLATCNECRARLDDVRKSNPGPGAADPMINRRY